jgi:hypothetical protein
MRRLLSLTLAGLLGCLIVEMGCNRRLDRRLEWQRLATHSLDEGRCEDTIKLLKGVPEEDTVRWQELLAFASMDCFKKTGNRGYVAFDLDRLSAAIARRPRSASLLHLKSHVLVRLGDREAAQPFEVQAKAQAEANLATGWSPDGLDADRRVLEDIRKSDTPVR